MGSWRCGLSNAETALDATFRADYGRLVAALTRRLGAQQLTLVEDAVQGAMVRALENWRGDELPERVDGWLLRVAYNLAVDTLRRDSRLQPLPDTYEERMDVAFGALDDELSLMFLCCHPSLTRAAQVALTLKITCGFSVQQIAFAFLSTEATIAQRLVRAKQRLRQVGARFELPDPDQLPSRLEPILDVLYLLFSEGHTPTDGSEPIVAELCAEALRLSRLLTEQPRTATPAAHALRALICFQAARAPARLADDGSLLLLHEQDRGRWDTGLIGEGWCALKRAGQGEVLSRFHLEAGIAGCHAAAPSYQATDWPQILLLYDALRERSPSPVVDVNRAVAVAMVSGALAGIDELDSIPERALLDHYPYALAAYAELHASLGHLAEARGYLARALEHQPGQVQRLLLQRKLAALASAQSTSA